MAKFRWPVRDWSLWYDAQPFGTITGYGFHEGSDINLATGGNSDYGQDLFPIFTGVVSFIEHHTTGFGSHIIYKITGPWGIRWVHYAHCIKESINVKVGDIVNPLDVIAKVGHTGNSRYNGVPNAHTHWAIMKKETHPDNIANNRQELNDIWEDPIAFVKKWLGYEGGEEMNDYKKKGIEELDTYRDIRINANGGLAPEGNWESYARGIIGGDKAAVVLNRSLSDAKVKNAQLSGENTNLKTKLETSETELEDLYGELSKELGVSVNSQTEAIEVLKEVLKQKDESGEAEVVLNGLQQFIKWLKSVWV